MGKATMSQTVSCPRATMKNRKDGLQVLRIWAMHQSNMKCHQNWSSTIEEFIPFLRSRRLVFLSKG
jgi:hypothetical protein